jgi:lipoprotein-anchoring transpeptidase ErfK/SrfK
MSLRNSARLMFVSGALIFGVSSSSAQPVPAQTPPGSTSSDANQQKGPPPSGQSERQQPSLTPGIINGASFGPIPADAAAPLTVKAEVLLDRAHASPGVIDGKSGQNFQNAIEAYETMHGLPVDGKLTQQVWSELSKDSGPVIGSYKITSQDVGYPFTPNIPTDYGQMAKMKAMSYRNETEMFAERFHMDQDLLEALNPGVDMTKSGNSIEAAQVQSPALVGKIVRIDVDKTKGQVRAYGENGKLIVAYPATVGSEELPSPSGTHKVKGVARRPVYSYDPQKNFKQGNNTKKLTIPAGPNNPVGIVYIALSKPTYGIHGTPDASKIDKTSSHGCVRLPNWDAQELAAHVRPGVVVHFLGTKGG